MIKEFRLFGILNCLKSYFSAILLGLFLLFSIACNCGVYDLVELICFEHQDFDKNINSYNFDAELEEEIEDKSSFKKKISGEDLSIEISSPLILFFKLLSEKINSGCSNILQPYLFVFFIPPCFS